MGEWQPAAAGVLRLPSGRLIRGRALRRPGAARDGEPEFGLYLQRRPPPDPDWPFRWVRWPDFGLPSDRDDALDALLETWRRCRTERVEVACGGGRGRTGTALACLAVLDGLPAPDAVRHVRRHYHHRAVETPWQRLFIRWFARHVPQVPA